MAGKRVLIGLSEFGYWGEELVGPLEVLDKAGYEITFFTPKGRRPLALPASLRADAIDPPLGKSVVTPEMAAKATALDAPSNPRLDEPINLSAWFPSNPYPSSLKYLREREAYFSALDQRKEEIAGKYDALLLVGGSGPLWDMANNFRVKDLIRCFYELGRPVACECYAVTCLAFTPVSEDDPRPIIRGKHVTGHPTPYDYMEGNAFWMRDRYTRPGQPVKPEDADWVATDFPTIPLQMLLEMAVGPEGLFHGNVGRETSVVVDYPFITGRSTSDSYATGEQLRKVLEDRTYRRYGW